MNKEAESFEIKFVDSMLNIIKVKLLLLMTVWDTCRAIIY